MNNKEDIDTLRSTISESRIFYKVTKDRVSELIADNEVLFIKFVITAICCLLFTATSVFGSIYFAVVKITPALVVLFATTSIIILALMFLCIYYADDCKRDAKTLNEVNSNLDKYIKELDDMEEELDSLNKGA